MKRKTERKTNEKESNLSAFANIKNNKNSSVGVSFLFGAGAESGAENFNILGGEEYNEKTAVNPDPKILDALSKYFPFVEMEKLPEIEKNFETQLDASFHSIALLHKDKPDLGGPFATVFRYYWLCYFAIAQGINKNFPNTLSEFKEPELILQRLADYQKALDSLDIEKFINQKTNSYYYLIQHWLKENSDCLNLRCEGVATSNYFRFCEAIEAKRSVCYLNGSFGLFEFPQTFEIKKIKSKKGIDFKNIFFPFMFGQSYVKPIVDAAQVRYFGNFSKSLSRSRFLVVLGYGIRETDDHINAVIAKYMRQQGKTAIFVVKDEKEQANTKRILSKVKRKNLAKFVYWMDEKKQKSKRNKEVVEEIFRIIEDSLKMAKETRSKS